MYAMIRTQHVQGFKLQVLLAFSLTGIFLGRAQAISFGTGSGSDGGQFRFMKRILMFWQYSSYNLFPSCSETTPGGDGMSILGSLRSWCCSICQLIPISNSGHAEGEIWSSIGALESCPSVPTSNYRFHMAFAQLDREWPLSR